MGGDVGEGYRSEEKRGEEDGAQFHGVSLFA